MQPRVEAIKQRATLLFSSFWLEFEVPCAENSLNIIFDRPNLKNTIRTGIKPKKYRATPAELVSSSLIIMAESKKPKTALPPFIDPTRAIFNTEPSLIFFIIKINHFADEGRQFLMKFENLSSKTADENFSAFFLAFFGSHSLLSK